MDAFAELMKYVPSLLIVIGAVFLLLAFGATVSRMQLVPFKARVATGIIGAVLLMLGIVLYLTPPPPPPPTPSPTETPTANTPAPTATDAPTSTPTPVTGFEVVALTSEVKAGGFASVTIQTAAGALCDLTYKTPAGTESESDDLKAKTADDDGLCTWTWRITAQTIPGTGTLTITANSVTESYAIVIK